MSPELRHTEGACHGVLSGSCGLLMGFYGEINPKLRIKISSLRLHRRSRPGYQDVNIVLNHR